MNDEDFQSLYRTALVAFTGMTTEALEYTIQDLEDRIRGLQEQSKAAKQILSER